VTMESVLAVRRAELADMQAIMAIERQSLEAPHWSESVWKETLTDLLPGSPYRVTFLAESVGRVLGFVVVSCVVGLAELESVAVEIGARRQGIGRVLCIAAMSWARERAATVIGLEVRASSEAALALYRSLGFTESGTRQMYYRDPIEHAVIMSARLAG
jgi:ribosomal-protein-alanine N-acetyltransferase